MNYRIEKWKEVYAPNGAMLRHVLTKEGYRVFQWCDQPGKMYAKHKHGEDQSHWIVSGKLEVTIENFGTVILEAGDRDFMPANTYHTARVIGNEPVIYLIGEKIEIEEVAEDYRKQLEVEQTREVEIIMSSNNKAKTLGELKKNGYESRSIKDEMRANLIKKLRIMRSCLKEFWVMKNPSFRR